MKKILLISLALFVCLAGFMSCDDWTDTDSKRVVEPDGKSDEYYENLRRWKAETQHDMSFGWYGFWSGTGVNLKNTMKGLPDSLHMISVWGPWLPSTLNEAKKADMELIQKVKGTKVLACSFAVFVGNGITENTPEELASWGWTWQHGNNNSCKVCVATDPTERAAQIASIEKYAKAMADSVIAGGYDGLDIDYEPTWTSGSLSNHKENMEELMRALGQYMGPKSDNPHLILAVDGEVQDLTKGTVPYLNYLIQQNYWTNQGRSDAVLNGRLKTVIDHLSSEEFSAEDIANMYFTTINFESYVVGGGGPGVTDYQKADGTRTNYLQGHAEWQPEYNGQTLRKAGYGSFHIEAEYTVPNKSGFYPWTRAALNAVHPPQE